LALNEDTRATADNAGPSNATPAKLAVRVLDVAAALTPLLAVNSVVPEVAVSSTVATPKDSLVVSKAFLAVHQAVMVGQAGVNDRCRLNGSKAMEAAGISADVTENSEVGNDAATEVGAAEAQA